MRRLNNNVRGFPGTKMQPPRAEKNRRISTRKRLLVFMVVFLVICLGEFVISGEPVTVRRVLVDLAIALSPLAGFYFDDWRQSREYK